MQKKSKRLVVAITGASGVVYGAALMEQLNELGIETHLVISSWAKHTIKAEMGINHQQVRELADYSYSEDNMEAPISSGSFLHDGMIICPCSMKTLSAIASGYGDNLITRAADVTIKEKRKLVLVPRETPLSPIHLENMLKLAQVGVIIMPPVIGFYQHPSTLQEAILQFTGRILDLLNIPNKLVNRWGRES
ncbi:MAG: UbiX family flavin prenyltransferase [Desulfotomaculum sp.]|nr:UbiX family flavin prenyltransferase [Desulfotomaculum sp.]